MESAGSPFHRHKLEHCESHGPSSPFGHTFLKGEPQSCQTMCSVMFVAQIPSQMIGPFSRCVDLVCVPRSRAIGLRVSRFPYLERARPPTASPAFHPHQILFPHGQGLFFCHEIFIVLGDLCSLVETTEQHTAGPTVQLRNPFGSN